MPSKIKLRPAGGRGIVSTLRPLMFHEVTGQTGAVNSAARRPMIPTQPASGPANHSRHHVSPKAQA